MAKITKSLLAIFASLIVLKSLLALMITAPIAFADDYTYFRAALSIFHQGTFLLDGVFTLYPPIYPALISLSFIFNDITLVYTFIKIINAIVSSLIIFPIYLLAKEFLNEKYSLIATAIGGIAGLGFLYPSQIMAENLSYPLTSFAIYFLYRTFKDNSLKYAAFSGLLISLAAQTKAVCYALFPVAFICFILLKKKGFSRIILHYSSILLITLPYQIMVKLNAPNTFLGYPKSSTILALKSSFTNKLPVFINWGINYTGYLILSSGIFLAIYLIAGVISKKEENLKILYTIIAITTLCFIFLAANHSSAGQVINPIFKFYTYRPIGRYIEVMLPFITLLGVISCQQRHNEKSLKTAVILTAIVLLISTQMTLSPLFPINNISVTFVGLTKAVLDFFLYSEWLTNSFHWGSFLVIALIFMCLPFLVLYIRKPALLISLTFIFLLSNLAMSYGIMYWNAEKNWAHNDIAEMGKWINKNIDTNKVIMIDSSDCKVKEKEDTNRFFCVDTEPKSSYLGMWVKNPLRYGTKPNNDEYFLTPKEESGYELITAKGDLRLYMNS